MCQGIQLNRGPYHTSPITFALKNLTAFQSDGFDAIILENNYDIPHTEFVDQAIITSMSYLIEKIRPQTKLPIGVSVLWNDYRTALSLAKTFNLQFIRIPVFVDKVKTACGIIEGEAKKVIAYRKRIGVEHVAIFTDIHVKHAELLSKKTILQSAKAAINSGSDGLIITGKWTGQAPDLNELERVRKSVGDFPIIIGSGTDAQNVNALFQFANGTIVSTALKKGAAKKQEVNVRGYDQRIDPANAKKFVHSIKIKQV
jgi:membrane complex biogenesis BtpA family protein